MKKQPSGFHSYLRIAIPCLCLAAAMAAGTLAVAAAPAHDPAPPAAIRLAQAGTSDESSTGGQTGRRKRRQHASTASSPCVTPPNGMPPDCAFETRQGSDAAGTLLGMVLLGVLLILVTGVVLSLLRFDREYRKKPKPVSRDGFVDADYGIPYCDYEKTAEGFAVSYRRIPEYVSMLDTKTSQNAGCAGVVVALFKLPFLIVALFWAAWIAGPTRIEVARDAVTINGQRYRRADFRGFGKYAPTQHEVTENMQGYVRVKSRCTLAFFYGSTSQRLPGLWKNDHRVDEFLAALNQHLQAVPQAA
jgi:hypothetical protein